MSFRFSMSILAAILMAGCGSSNTSTSAFSTGTIPAGGSASHQFAAAGSFPYHCSFHPNMVAAVNVQ